MSTHGLGDVAADEQIIRLVVNFSVHDLQLLQIFYLLGGKFNILDDALVQPLD